MRSTLFFSLFAIVLAVAGVGPTMAQQQPVAVNNNAALPAEQPLREILVPFQDLNVILASNVQRVFMTRTEYQNLLDRASQRPGARPPQDVAIVSGTQTVNVGEGRAAITSTLQIDVLDDGLQALPLALSEVAVQLAHLDDEPASLVQDSEQGVLLLIEGKGRHTLKLELLAPMQISAAQQTLQGVVPHPASAQFLLNVPGNVEIKSGAQVLSRTFDEPNNTTRFELLPPRGRMTIVMSLNNRRLRDNRMLLARSVIVDELTEAYERIHATVSLQVLQGAVDQLAVRLPGGFEVTRVHSPTLARWSVEQEDDGTQRLTAQLRDFIEDGTVVTITANRLTPEWDHWQFPQLGVDGVVSQTSVLGVLAERRLILHDLATTNLVALNNGVLSSALPASLFETDPGAPPIQLLTTYYAPQPDYQLEADVRLPAKSLNATANLLMTLAESGQEVRGGLVLLPDVEDLFQFQFVIPTGWQVSELTDQDGTILDRDETLRDGERRMRVTLPRSIAAGGSGEVYFVARRVPTGWLGNWDRQTVQFPRFRVLDTDQQIGAVAVQLEDDLALRPLQVEGLTALGNSEKGDFGLEGVDTRVAYYFDTTDFALELEVSRTAPLVTARSQSFFKVLEGAIETNYELSFDIQKSSLDTLEFSLPLETPSSLQIRGLEGGQVKQQSSRELDGRRIWTVHLHNRSRGVVTLGIHTQIPFGDIEAGAELVEQLPMVRAESVSYQSGVVAVEGSVDLDVSVQSGARQVDVGDLIALDYVVGDRLLGGYGFVDQAPEIELTIRRHPEHAIPAVMVSRAQLVTFLSANGQSQSVARYAVNSKASYLQIALPAESRVWAILIDEHPVRPQQRGDRLLISLTHEGASSWRDLRVVYNTTVSELGVTGTLQGSAPRLYEGSAQTDVAVQIADMDWQVVLPNNYQLTRIRGSLVRVDHQPRQLSESMSGLFGLLALMTDVGPRASSARTTVDSAYSYDRSGSQRSSEDGRTMSQRADYGGEGGQSGAGYESAMEPGMDFESGAEGESDESAPADMPKAAAPEAATPFAPPTETPAEEPQPTPDPTAEAIDLFEDKRESGEQADGVQLHGGTQLVVPRPGDEASFGKESDAIWALEGIRSLNIDLSQRAAVVPAERLVHLTSLGEGARWQVSLAHRQHILLIAGFLSLMALLVGLALSRAATRIRYRYVCGLMVAGAVLPVLGLFPSLNQAWDNLFVVGLILVPVYLVTPLVIWGLSSTRQFLRKRAIAAGLSLLMLATSSAGLQAQEVAESDAPVRVKVPADAIIVPYDPDKLGEAALSERVLIPYQRYADLWKRAFPNRPLLEEILPSTYALASSQFEATLLDGDSILLRGFLDVDVFTDEEVGIPLVLHGGVLRTALIDGKPARLQVLPTAAAQQDQQIQQAANAAPQVPLAPTTPSFRLLLKGKGRTRLEMTVAMTVTRQGGWRIIQGVLPVAPASRLSLQVPTARTEVRWSGTTDRGEEVSTADNELLNLSPDPLGHVQFRWRPTVAESTIDRSLTARSSVLVDVQEEAVHSVWNVNLQFRRGQRDLFQFELPMDYQVERVNGDNVRGWDVKLEEGKQSLTVELLEAARGQTLLQLHLVRHGKVGEGEFSQFDAPVVAIPDAILHQGIVAIRRTSLMTLRTVTLDAVTREDLTREAAGTFQAREAARLSPLGLLPFQVYQFSDTPFQVRIAAERLPAATNVDLQTLVRIAERDLEIESRVRVKPGRLAVYRLDLLVPANLEVDEVQAPALVDWSLAENEDEEFSSTLTILLGSGRRQPFDVVIRGSVPRVLGDQSIQLPEFFVEDVLDQSGTIVVQTDPSYDVDILQSVNVQQQTVRAADGWLQSDQQRSLARLVLTYRNAKYGVAVQLVRRKSRITANSITNIRVTDRAIEETLLLEFRIADAGVDELRFQLPSTLRDARISAGLMRQITMEPVDPEQPAGMQQVILSLQDEVIGQFKVLIEHDRVLDDAQLQLASIPVIQAGQTTARHVTIDSTGDEVSVAGQDGMEELAPQSAAYQALVSRIGGTIGKAYSATSPQAELQYQITRREVREVVSARISLSTVTIVMDEQGAFRARQEYEMDNRVEQFLDVRLPADSHLWVVQVAGKSVKPRSLSGSAGEANRVRIPIQRLAEGDAELKVVLIYGGTTSVLSSWGRIQFPFVELVSQVNIEKTHIALHLPSGHNWYGFDGTAEQVESYDDLESEFLAGKRNQNEQVARSTLQGKDAYAISRFRNNLKRQQIEYEQLKNTRRDQGIVQQNIDQNLRLLDDVEKRLEELQEEDEQQFRGNRFYLNQGFEEQSNDVSRNSVQMLGDNFARPATQAPADPSTEGRGRFEKKWFAFNGLVVPDSSEKKAEGKSRVDMNESNTRTRQPMSKRPMSKPMGGKAAPPPPAPGSPDGGGGDDMQQAPQRRASQLELYQRKLDADFKGVQRELDLRGQQGQLPTMDSIVQQPSSGIAGPGAGGGGDMNGGPVTGSGGGMAGMGGMMGGGGGGFGGGGGRPANQGLPEGGEGINMGNQQPDDFSNFTRGQPPAAVDGLASLSEFDIPLRGEVFLFKTVGGTVELEARHIDTALAEGGSRLFWLAGSLLGLLLVVQVGGRMARHPVVGLILAALMCLYSLLILASSPVALLGVPLLAVAVTWVCWLLARRKAARQDLLAAE